MSGRVTLLSSTVVATGPTRSCKTSLPTAELIQMNFPLEFRVILPPQPLEPRAPNQLLQKHWGVFFAGELDGVTVGNV